MAPGAPPSLKLRQDSQFMTKKDREKDPVRSIFPFRKKPKAYSKKPEEK